MEQHQSFFEVMGKILTKKPHLAKTAADDCEEAEQWLEEILVAAACGKIVVYRTIKEATNGTMERLEKRILIRPSTDKKTLTVQMNEHPREACLQSGEFCCNMRPLDMKYLPALEQVLRKREEQRSSLFFGVVPHTFNVAIQDTDLTITVKHELASGPGYITLLVT
jgi:hypothetical protein